MTSSVFAPIPDVTAGVSGLPPQFGPVLQTISTITQSVNILTGVVPGYNAITADKITSQPQSQSQSRPNAQGKSGGAGPYADGADYQTLAQDVYVLFQQVQSIQTQINAIIGNMKA